LWALSHDNSVSLKKNMLRLYFDLFDVVCKMCLKLKLRIAFYLPLSALLGKYVVAFVNFRKVCYYAVLIFQLQLEYN
jgi:hypothetical protein